MGLYKNLPIGLDWIMRPRFLIYSDAFDELGGVRLVSRILGVEEGTVRKYEEDPERSGREMPVPAVIDVLAALSARQAGRSQALVDEVLSHFATPARRKILRDGAIEQAFEILKNGNGNSHARCPGCGAGLKDSGMLMGQTVYTCPGCKGAEVR